MHALRCFNCETVRDRDENTQDFTRIARKINQPTTREYLDISRGSVKPCTIVRVIAKGKFLDNVHSSGVCMVHFFSDLFSQVP